MSALCEKLVALEEKLSTDEIDKDVKLERSSRESFNDLQEPRLDSPKRKKAAPRRRKQSFDYIKYLSNPVKAWNCRHKDRPNLSRGLCSSCYQSEAHKNNSVKAFNCEHISRPNYSFGLCKPCYRKYSRKSKQIKAWLCEHSDRPHEAKGLCHQCYEKIGQ